MQNSGNGFAADDKGIRSFSQPAVTDLSRIASDRIAKVVVHLADVHPERETGDPKIAIFLIFIQHAEITHHRLAGKAAFI